ncbi:MAG: T9SS type A sorting domain-containing protein, partial [Melioribacteraceae bacterium]
TTAIDSKYDHGLHLRRSSQNKINNILLVGWAKDGIFIDGAQTNADAKAGISYVKNAIIAGASKAIDTTKAGSFDINKWFTDNANRYFADNSGAGLVSPFSLPNPAPIPTASSPALTGAGTPPNDGFFDVTANYVGAFKSTDWTAGWSTIHMGGVYTSIKETFNDQLPSRYELLQNYPNPFNPSTTIRFSLPQEGLVKLSIYNVLGQEVANLINGFRAAGTYNVNWNAGNYASGLYIYRLETANNVLAKKMLLMK